MAIENPCRCAPECAAVTSKSFAQGHDARMISRLARAVVAGEIKIERAEAQVVKAGGSARLVAKMVSMVESMAAKKAKAADNSMLSDRKLVVLAKQKKVIHGTREIRAQLVLNSVGESVLRHRAAGKNCDHDSRSGKLL